MALHRSPGVGLKIAGSSQWLVSFWPAASTCGSEPASHRPPTTEAKTVPEQWWARQDLNLQPTDYESAALTRLSYGPRVLKSTSMAPARSSGRSRKASGARWSPSNCITFVRSQSGSACENGKREDPAHRG